jgi:glycosyltransferase involved in cell wall biosynthesis
LRQSGLEVHVVSSDQLPGVEQDRYFHWYEPDYGWARNLPNMPELLFNDHVIRMVDRQWPDWRPSFIYQRYSLGNYAGVVLKLKHDVPLVCEYNGSFPWIAYHWGGRRLFHERLVTRIELLNLRAADLIVVVSDASRQELVGRDILDEKILVNPNGVDTNAYSPRVDGEPVRQGYGLEGKIVIGFIGSFGKWHGAEVLANAFGLLLTRFPIYRDGVRLLMIGDGPTMPQVKEELKKFDTGDRCILTGRIPQEDGCAHLAACDILVSPHVPNPDGTPFFGSPTKLFEYMAMGKGIVASDLNQIGEVLEHEKTALMVKPGDAESLVFALSKLIEDEQGRKKLGQAARREVVAKYTWKEHTRKIVEKLKERCE